MSPALQPLGRGLIVVGAVLLGVGALLLLAPKIPWLGHLPGDIFIQRERFTFYFPLATCLLVSVLLTVLLWLMGRFR